MSGRIFSNIFYFVQMVSLRSFFKFGGFFVSGVETRPSGRDGPVNTQRARLVEAVCWSPLASGRSADAKYVSPRSKSMRNR